MSRWGTVALLPKPYRPELNTLLYSLGQRERCKFCLRHRTQPTLPIASGTELTVLVVVALTPLFDYTKPTAQQVYRTLGRHPTWLSDI